jgi:hypothetical protein
MTSIEVYYSRKNVVNKLSKILWLLEQKQLTISREVFLKRLFNKVIKENDTQFFTKMFQQRIKML